MVTSTSCCLVKFFVHKLYHTKLSGCCGSKNNLCVTFKLSKLLFGILVAHNYIFYLYTRIIQPQPSLSYTYLCRRVCVGIRVLHQESLCCHPSSVGERGLCQLWGEEYCRSHPSLPFCIHQIQFWLRLSCPETHLHPQQPKRT